VYKIRSTVPRSLGDYLREDTREGRASVDQHLANALARARRGDIERMIRDVHEAACTKAVQLPILKAATESEIDAAFATLDQQHTGALVVSPDPFFIIRREHLVALASPYAVPAIYPLSEFAALGGLMSYAASVTEAFHLLGIYTARVLKGEKPADLPVQQPTRFELVVNLNTAKALGLTVPPSILARADEVIE
jgi:putative tryptophan/tyrosine transport system substrate-binding protein